jgi:transposase-like protein
MARKLEYTKEFQDNAVRLVVADGKSYIIAARELGIPVTMLRV